MSRAKKNDTTDDKSITTQVKSDAPKADKKADAPKPTEDEQKMTKNEIVCDVEMPIDEPAFSTEFSQILSQLQSLTQQFSSLRSSLRTLEKKTIRDLKVATKAGKKNKRTKSNRQPSGFVKPTLISTELAEFLGKPKGTEMARTEVTKEINSYIRANSLQDPKNGRRIIPDPKLTTLLNLKDIDELTYFNLQKFMSPHFAKASDLKVPTEQLLAQAQV